MTTNTDMTLGEAAGRYLASIKDQERATAQTELNRFIRHFGTDYRTSGLRAIDVEDYQEKVERTGADVTRRLEPLKSFLMFIHKQGGSEINFGKFIKTRRSTAARPTGRKASRVVPNDEDSVSLTGEGYQNLKQELEYLTTVKRAEIARDLYEARIDKDFRENAPYDAAKQHQAEVEARIRQLEHTLAVAQVVDLQKLENQIGIGSTVLLKDLTHEEELTYTLVGTSEANPVAGRISIVSPVGKALIDRHVGDEIEVAAPIGLVRYRVEKIVT